MDWCEIPSGGPLCGLQTAWRGVTGAAGQVIEDGSVRVLSAIAEGVTSFATMLLDALWSLIQTVTQPQTDADFLYQWAGMLFGIALPITVIFMCFQVIQSVLRARGFTRSGVISAVTGAAVAILGTSVSLPIVHYLTRMVDGAADAMTGVILGDIDTLGDAFSDAIGGDGVSVWEALIPGGPGQQQLVAESAAGVVGGLGGLVGMIVLGFLMIVGGIAVFAALLIRTQLLYAVEVTGPIAFLGLVWSPVRPWFRRWVTAVLALVFTKLGVVVVFGLGVSALNNLTFDGGVLEAIGRLLSGVILMLVAAMVPVVAFKFFGFLGEEAVESLHAGSQGAIGRTTEAFGRMDPRRVADRINSNGHGGGAPSSPTGSSGGTSGAQPARASQQSSRPEWTSSGARRGQSDPWTGGGTGNGGKPGAGWSKPSSATSSSGAGSGGAASGAGGAGAAAGGAGAVAGAVVGAGVAAGQKAAETGSRAGAVADEQQPSSGRDPYAQNPWRGSHPDGDKPSQR